MKGTEKEVLVDDSSMSCSVVCYWLACVMSAFFNCDIIQLLVNFGKLTMCVF